MSKIVFFYADGSINEGSFREVNLSMWIKSLKNVYALYSSKSTSGDLS